MSKLKKETFEKILNDIVGSNTRELEVKLEDNGEKIKDIKDIKNIEDDYELVITKKGSNYINKVKVKRIKQYFDDELSLVKKDGDCFIYDNRILYFLIEEEHLSLIKLMFSKHEPSLKVEDDKYEYSQDKVPLGVYLNVINGLNSRTPMRLILDPKDKQSGFEVLGREYSVLKLQPKNIADPELKDIKKCKNLLMAYYFKLLDLGKQYRIVEPERLNGKIRSFPNKSKKSKLTPPLKTYDENLIKMFAEANASNNPFTQFIEYYQIIEYFFGEAYDNDLCKELKKVLYTVDFSLEKNTDLKALEKVMKKFLSNKENERQMLKRVLEDYIDLRVLSNKLGTEMCDFYSDKDNRPIFLGNQENSSIIFDINSLKKEKVYSAMTDRIYRVRNAIVHNKRDNKSSYLPQEYTHVKALSNEIPLIREVASMCITSSVINH